MGSRQVPDVSGAAAGTHAWLVKDVGVADQTAATRPADPPAMVNSPRRDCPRAYPDGMPLGPQISGTEDAQNWQIGTPAAIHAFSG